jgi:hypothetical protein
MLLQNSNKKGPRCWHGHFWLLPTSRPLFKKKCWGDDITHPSDNVVTPLYSPCILQILAPVYKVVIQRGFKKNFRDPYEAIEASNGSLAQFFDRQEAKKYKNE